MIYRVRLAASKPDIENLTGLLSILGDRWIDGWNAIESH